MSEYKTDVRNASDCLALAVLILLICWFCQDIIFSAQVLFFRDLSTYFYPMRYSLFDSYRAGNLPLWDRHTAMGFPLLADFQSGAFYPPHVFFGFCRFFQPYARSSSSTFLSPESALTGFAEVGSTHLTCRSLAPCSSLSAVQSYLSLTCSITFKPQYGYHGLFFHGKRLFVMPPGNIFWPSRSS